MDEPRTLREIEIHDRHFHNRERWFGKLGVQTATAWAEAESLTTFQAISGNGAFGADADDEAKVLGTDDTPIITGQTRFDMRRILFQTLSVDTPYVLRIVWGTGTMADAITAGQYSNFQVQNIVAGSKAGGVPVDLIMLRLWAGIDQVWIQAKCATDNATVDFFVGVHGYDQ